MIKNFARGLMLSVTMLLAACAADKKSLGNDLQTTDLVFTGTYEKAPDKIDVYYAMARAAKYNADVSAQNMFKKIYGKNENPVNTVEAMFNAGQPEDKLYNAARAMDFADIYAMSVLTDNQGYIENNLYAKSAQNLSLAAIKLQREEIFALKQIKKIDRILNQQGKILTKLNEQAENDELTVPQLNYRKNLEVALNNLGEIKKQLLFTSTEYSQLLKMTDKNLSLTGKRFYELEDFDKNYTPDIFADSAAANRREFALAKEQLGSFNTAKARRQAYVDYPPVARLDINGLQVDDLRYETELFNKAQRVTMNLLNAVNEYQNDKKDERVKQKAFDELAALVMTQVELAYRSVEKASFDYEANRYKLSEAKELLREMKKKDKLPDYEKIDLLNQEIAIIALEQKEAQILAERAAALRNLYYLAGLSPFDKNMLKGKIADIEDTLRKAFNKDVVVMLSAVKEQPRWDDGGNAWAHKDGWLEELIDGGDNKSHKKVSPAKKKANKQIKTVMSAQNKTLLQLGAYTDMNNAVEEQLRIKNNVAALSGYDMFIEDAVVNGVLYHRIMVKPEKQNLKSLCNQIIAQGFECILR